MINIKVARYLIVLKIISLKSIVFYIHKHVNLHFKLLICFSHRGLLKIADVESRFVDVNSFINDVEKFGFKTVHNDFSHNMFYFLSFKKVSVISKHKKKKLPDLKLNPCLYKKR